MATAKAGYFLKDGTKVPSVTTVLSRFKESGGLIHWAWKLGTEGKDYRRVRDDSATAGTLAHEMIERRILGSPPLAYDPKVPEELWVGASTALESFVKWEAEHGLKIVATERPLVSEKFRFGGTLDAIGLVDGELVILDWKSGNRIYAEAVAQCAAYRQLWNENHPRKKCGTSAHIVRVSKDAVEFDHAHVPLADGWEYFRLLNEALPLVKKLEALVKPAP